MRGGRAGWDSEVERLEVVKAMAGDETAFETLVGLVAEPLVRYAITIVRDEEAAIDVMHDALLRAHRRLHSLRSADAFRPWLWRIARFAALDRWRRGKRVDLTGPDAGPLLDSTLVPAPAPPCHPRARGLATEDIREAVDELPRLSRQVVSMRYGHDMSYAEIGRQAGLTTSQVKARLSRARAAIRRQLEFRIRRATRLDAVS